MTAAGLHARRAHPELFGRRRVRSRSRLPTMPPSRSRAAGVETWAIACAPRLSTRLAPRDHWPVGTDVWGDRALTLPPDAPQKWRDVYTDAEIEARDGTPARRRGAHAAPRRAPRLALTQRCTAAAMRPSARRSRAARSERRVAPVPPFPPRTGDSGHGPIARRPRARRPRGSRGRRARFRCDPRPRNRRSRRVRRRERVGGDRRSPLPTPPRRPAARSPPSRSCGAAT